MTNDELNQHLSVTVSTNTKYNSQEGRIYCRNIVPNKLAT